MTNTLTLCTHCGSQCWSRRWSEGSCQSGQLPQSHPPHRRRWCRCRNLTWSGNPASTDTRHQKPGDREQDVKMMSLLTITLTLLTVYEQVPALVGV